MKNAPLLYAPPALLADPAQVTLPPEEAAHAVRVLRRRPGDEIQVADGEGHWYRVRLDHVANHHVTGTVLERRADFNEPPSDLCIGLALLKSRQRFETFLEKAVELGVTSVFPLVTERTEVRSMRMARARQKMIAALKQSRRCRLPRLHAPVNLDRVMAACTKNVRMIAHPGATKNLLTAAQENALRDVCVLVGPEGGFTGEEVSRCLDRGYSAVSLGPRRLRSETAAIAAAAVVSASRARPPADSVQPRPRSRC